MKRSPWLLIGVVSLSSCALFSKGEVATRRYYSPDLPVVAASSIDRKPGLQLRLGRVTANRTISERIVYRDSEHEVTIYDDRIWTERPEAYLTRGLNRVLFEERGLQRVVGGPGQTLEVELLRFEEIRVPAHAARVRLSFSLSDERLVSLQKTVDVELPIAQSTVEMQGTMLAEAMGQALREAVTGLSNQVIAQLESGTQAKP